jgi:hypothetical protein
MIRRPRGIQLSWISEISLSLTWQRLDREDHAFALPSDAWTGDEPSGSVKLYNVPYYRALIPAPVAAIGLELINVMVWRTDAEPCPTGELAATSNRYTKIRIARALPRVLRGVQQGGDSRRPSWLSLKT